MACTVDCEVALDPRLGEPMMEAELDLTSAKGAAGPGWKQRIVRLKIHPGYVGFQDPPELRREVNRSRNPPLAVHHQRMFREPHILDSQLHQSPEPDARLEQEREHHSVSPCRRTVFDGDCSEKVPGLCGFEVLWGLRLCPSILDEPRRVALYVARIRQELEEDPERGLGSVEGNGGFARTVDGSEVSGEHVRIDGRDVRVTAEPVPEPAQISNVCTTRMLTPAICP